VRGNWEGVQGGCYWEGGTGRGVPGGGYWEEGTGRGFLKVVLGEMRVGLLEKWRHSWKGSWLQEIQGS